LSSASNTIVPKDTAITTVKRKLFSFLWNKKKDKIKREGLYQEYAKGGIRTTDVSNVKGHAFGVDTSSAETCKLELEFST